MASTQRIPSDAGRGSEKERQQTAKAPQVTRLVVAFCVATTGLLSGCTTATPFAKKGSRFATPTGWKANDKKLITFADPAPRNAVVAKTVQSTSGAKRTATSENSSGGSFKQVSFQTDSDAQDEVSLLLNRDESDTPELNSSDSDSANQIAGGTEENIAVKESTLAGTDATTPAAAGGVGRAPSPNSLRVEQVLRSVSESYPEIAVAIGEIEAAAGKVIASWGEFDTVASAHSISQPLGFYQTYRNGAGVSRPLYSGGEVYSTFRIGDGNFEPWFGERETNEGGELKAGFSVPLLKDRDIDKRRAKLLSAGALQKEVQADVEARLLMFERFATQAYWDWVAAGQAVKVQESLLELADERVFNINERIKEDDLEKIAQYDNNLFIANRKADLIKVQQYFRKTAIKLSMFYRDAGGAPILADVDRLPAGFPNAGPLPDQQILQDTSTALSIRPEFAAYRAARESACIDSRYAQNLMLPKFDIKGFAGQDLGGETSSKGDKTPFELNLGAFYELPLERRKGIGMRQVAQSKIAQIDAKVEFLGNKIQAEIQEAATALNAAYEQIQQRRTAVEEARKSLEAFRFAFDEGDKTLLDLNFYETYVAEAELKLIDAQFKYFLYRAVYETAVSGEGLAEFDGEQVIDSF